MANVNYEILTPVSVEPVDLTTMKTFLRVDYSDEDTLISSLISQAREYAEEITRRALAPQVIRATIIPEYIPEGELSGPIDNSFDTVYINERISSVPFGFYGPRFELPRNPISLVTVVEYQLTPFDNPEWTSLPEYDSNNNVQWLLDTNTNPMAITLMPLLVANRYRFTYNAGYNNSAGYSTGAVPSSLITDIMQLVSFWFDNRQGQPIPDGITASMARKRVFKLLAMQASTGDVSNFYSL